MAIVRDINDSDNFYGYLATIALFCGISCTILMLRFKGFKASLNLSSGKRSGKEHFELAPQVSVNGAYRTSRQEYYANNYCLDPPKKITPSMVKLPPNENTAGNIKPSKSTGDLSKVINAPVEVRKSTPNVATTNAAQNSKDAKNQLKEQKKLEKERLAEQKKREKLAAQEREKQEKLRKEREKQEAQQAKQAKEKEKQRKKKAAAPLPNQKPTPQQKANAPQARNNAPQQSAGAPKQENQNIPPPPPPPPTDQQLQPNASTLFQKVQHSTNTLESSISRSSGPPPYSDTPQVVLNMNDNTGNTSFVKPVESSSWDMISQHRQQMSKTTGATGSKPKQTTLDLRYNVGNVSAERDNSEA